MQRLSYVTDNSQTKMSTIVITNQPGGYAAPGQMTLGNRDWSSGVCNMCGSFKICKYTR